MDNDKTKFWAVLIGVMVAVAVAVTLVDLTIKAAILQESNAFKLAMNGVKHGTGSGTAQTDTNGADHYRHNNGRDAGDDVVPFPARMEATNIRKSRARKTTPGPMAGTIEHSERMGNNGVATGDIEVDT